MNEEDRNYQIKQLKQDTKLLKSIGINGLYIQKAKRDKILNLLNDKKSQDSFKNLDEIRIAVERCERCPLHKERKNTVFSRGSAMSDVMFIGEGPGKDEDEAGLPFVGRAGQLLNKILEAMKLPIDNVYICNIVKCRPPQNRKPTFDEIDSCSHYLMGQISFVKPKVIICLGATAAEGILGTKERIKDLRGKFFDKYNAKIIVTYHPAALLRDPSRKKLVWEDMQLVMREIGQ
ncbi:MAG TPA: uracil-DNA glycosylase [Pelagibacterales bacterium]|nr:uracil-DNA glycosylase [Pelagibacterales bacterium]